MAGKDIVKDETPSDPKFMVLPEGQTAMVDYGEDAGTGFENQSVDDVSIPFIDILQPGSPEVVTAGKGGARAGEIINRVTGETWEGDTGIVVIPAITEHVYTEWKPKKGPNGETLPGGFVARHALEEEMSQRARKESPFKPFRLPNGNDLLETFYVPSLQVDESTGNYSPVILAFGSTKIPAYKNWMYIARAIQVLTKPVEQGGRRVNPPLFSHKYRITTKMKEKDGNRWFIPVIGFAGKDAETSRLLPNDQAYLAARDVKVSYTRGDIKADYAKTSADVTVQDDGKPPF